MGNVAEVKEAISRRFNTKDSGPVSRVVGMDILRDRLDGSICQGGHIREVIMKCGFECCRGVPTSVEGKVKLEETEIKEGKEETR